jgi:hypothetical protein
MKTKIEKRIETVKINRTANQINRMIEQNSNAVNTRYLDEVAGRLDAIHDQKTTRRSSALLW